jgi:NAD(P)-dependent dehydrogenase (short-subunit alcohol dehydrogenase family)
MGRFNQQVAIVTGAGSGIGQEVAHRLALEGAAVCVADINAASGHQVAKEIRDRGGKASAHQLDVTDATMVDQVVRAITEEYGTIDLLVNNAAVANDTPLDQLGVEEFERDVDVALKGTFLCCHAVLNGMVERCRGAIVNLGSVNAARYFGNDAYSAAKAGVVSLTRSVAVRYGRFGIRANVVAPGTVRTPAWDARVARDPKIFDRLSQWYPLGRVGTSEDIAAAVLFLASTDASWITGTVLTVDGGLLAGTSEMADSFFAVPNRSPAQG